MACRRQGVLTCTAGGRHGRGERTTSQLPVQPPPCRLASAGPMLAHATPGRGQPRCYKGRRSSGEGKRANDSGFEIAMPHGGLGRVVEGWPGRRRATREGDCSLLYICTSSRAFEVAASSPDNQLPQRAGGRSQRYTTSHSSCPVSAYTGLTIGGPGLKDRQPRTRPNADSHSRCPYEVRRVGEHIDTLHRSRVLATTSVIMYDVAER